MTARVHQLRAVHADQDGDLEAALAHHEASLASFERIGDLRNACLMLSNLGFVRVSLGALAEAEEALLRAGAGVERMGLTTVAALAEAMRAQGRAGEVLIAAKEAAGLLASIKSIEDFEVLIGLAHAGALEACGEPEAAKEAIAGAWRRLSARADRLKGATRTRFLGAVTDNARCRELAQMWGVTGEDEG